MKEKLVSISPSDLIKAGEVEVTTGEEIVEIVRKAGKAQQAWEALGFEGRRPFFDRLVTYLFDHWQGIAKSIAQENGKPYLEATLAEVYPVIDDIKYFAKRASVLLSDRKIPIRLFKFIGKQSYLTYRPVGVVGIISPWNYPYLIPFSEVIMALVAGNAVILKPSELTPLTGGRIKEALDAAGFPEDVFSIIYGGGKTGAELVRAGLSKIIFTGSVATGKKIMATAAESLTPVVLELGGKDPMVVLKDADLDMAARGAVWAAFMNSGQTCASVERVYVDKSVKDRFTDLVVQYTKRLRHGGRLDDHSTDVGAMIDARQLAIVEDHVADAVSRGARVLAGGKRPEGLKGYFFQPTVLDNVDHRMKIMTDETFGPCLPIMSFNSEEEAVQLANDSRYALTASVWSRDIRRAKSLARRMVAGTVAINEHAMTYGIPETPWGGSKESGFGRTHSTIGLMEMVEPVHIHVDRGWLRRKPWWYPYNDSTSRFIGAIIWLTRHLGFLID